MSETKPSVLTDTSVAEAMHGRIYGCPPDTALSEVAEIMVGRGIHAVVVSGVDGGVRSVGMISDLDLIAAATTRGLHEQAAGGSAASPAVTITPDAPLGLAAELMTRHGTAHLLVVDGLSGLPVGVLSTMDIVAALAG
jgi:CBS domain-containing protein